ncbi:MAG: AAA family ATPase [Verrucomicrobiales bacterium]
MKKLSIVCGAAGVGKSTYARQLALARGACLLDSDTVTEPVVRAGLTLAGLDPGDRDSPLYKETFRDAVYECLFATAGENLPQREVIIVGPFTRECREEDWPERLRARFGCEVEILFVACGEEERRERIAARGNPRDAAKLADWESYARESRLEPPAFPHVLVQT